MTKKKLGILFVGLLLITTIIVTLLYNPKSPGSEESGTSSMVLPVKAKVNVYTIDEGWAYEILFDSKVFIFQESIPGIASNKKFQSKTDAQKCGELVLKKIKQKKIPSITKAELDSLGIVY